jgi:uncharacterized protein (TIGR02271 family)
MARTTDAAIIAVFRSNTDAQAASKDLEAAGISRSDIYIENGPGTKSSSRSNKETGVAGWFKSIFSSDDDPDRAYYERAINEGRTLLRVDLEENDVSTVEDILNRHSPIDIYAEDETRTEAAAAGQAQSVPVEGRTAASAGQTKTVPVVKENIQVGKRQVLRGGVRVYSRVVEEPVEENVRLREEHVRVERQPVNRAATDADLAAGKEQVIEVQEFAEEPVVGKDARVVEEVRVGKDVSERTETVRDAVRHTDVNVERTGGTSGAAVDDTDFRSDFESRYAASGASYDTYLPAYQYGYDMASDPRYRGRSFDEVEADLRKNYGQRYPESAWERMKDAIRYGWNRVTGKTKAAAR